ncbi:MAG: lipoprotein-releasing system ATP-binding protein LolD [Epsilonproteobacteria bacterium]|nr:MAG: lipoprotein-releasing system ATP-binding protein LolD [Campylobacterota bacterium]RLA66705.1 MAG: lipoprotein-releasing system ATP-binding protein LolD [Campylobacterota bacterium]
MNSFIELSNVKKSYGQFNALKDVSLTLNQGSHYVIQGASGSGKSTLLYLIGGLDSPSSGQIYFNGEDLSSFGDEKLASYRNTSVGLVFQFHFLLPSMNCLDNILLPSRIGGLRVGKVKKEVLSIAENLGVTHCLKKFPYELSGGEQQRVNIIRALSLKPKLLLCDEPTGNLDSSNSNKVISLIKELAETYGSTLVVVTHDDGVAHQFPQKFFLKDGVLDD